MPTLAPFRGWRYDPDKEDLDRVLAPPYDVIDPEEQAALYARDPHNVVRLVLGLQYAEDNEADNRYIRAAGHLAAWQQQGVLVQDPPALYACEQTFSFQGREHRRRGLFARVRLEPFGAGSVFPHERTLSGPKQDRLELMRACRGNLSPVFGLLTDSGNTVRDRLEQVAQTPPTIDVADDSSGRTRMWTLTEAQAAADLCRAAGPEKVYIADGHHRYETALNYRDEVRRGFTEAGAEPPAEGEHPADWVLMMCVPVTDPGLVIGPTHRLVHDVADFAAQRLLDGLAERFEVAPASADAVREALSRTGPPPAFGLAVGTDLYLARLRDAGAMDARAPDKPPAWRRLDVAALHLLVLEDLLGIDEGKLLRKENVDYARDLDAALARAREDEAVQCAFLVRPTTMDEVRAVSESGEVMPQKSTFFFPKIPSGLVLNLF